MKQTVKEKVLRVLRTKLDITKKYVAAVSGGADSMALAEGLRQAGFDFLVCHVEHGIRGAESLDDARFVKEFCRQRGIPFDCRTVRAPEFRQQEKLSMEDAARRLRYEALLSCAEEVKADYILTAHQKDDQAETFILRLLRGSGTRGLGAMRFQRERILRPLLTLSGRELRDFCTEMGIVWREDKTNQDLQYARNRVRKLLIPLIEEQFSPAATDILCRTAEHLQADSDFLEEMADQELRHRWNPSALGGQGVLDVSEWENVPGVLRFRILRQFWRHAGGPQELTGVNLRDLAQLIEKKSSGKKILLPGSWQVLRSYDKLILFSSENLKADPDEEWWRYEIGWEQIPFAGAGEGDKGRKILFPDGRSVCISIRRGMPSYVHRRQMIYPLSQLRQLGSSLAFRFRQPGDRIFPLKGTGHKTLKKYLVECRIPVEKRDHLVLAAVEGEIVWIPGVSNARWSMDQDVNYQSQDWLFINLLG